VHNLDPNHKNIFTSIRRNNGVLHPTEKPTDILTRLIKTHSREGEVVLDLFCGSYSTIISCMNSKRHFIGFELDNYYYEWGQERIRKLLASRGVKDLEEWYKK
jgi:site-specific DNA-methyltransferase (adenine-specific)